VNTERWAQIGITTQFLIVVRTLGEIFGLRHIQGATPSAAVAMPHIGGALIAACSCWIGVTLHFFRRYILSAWIALATVLLLLVYSRVGDEDTQPSAGEARLNPHSRDRHPAL